MKKCHCLQQDLNPGPCGCKSNVIPTQPQQLPSLYYMQKGFIYEILPQISFLVMKSCVLALRIIVIHGVSLMNILNIPSLSRSVGRISRELRSLKNLPPSLLRSGIFTDTHSFTHEYYQNEMSNGEIRNPQGQGSPTTAALESTWSRRPPGRLPYF